MRMSTELAELLDEIVQDLGVTKTDVVLYFLCAGVDPSGVVVPDMKNIPEVLSYTAEPPSKVAMTHDKRKLLRIAKIIAS